MNFSKHATDVKFKATFIYLKTSVIQEGQAIGQERAEEPCGMSQKTENEGSEAKFWVTCGCLPVLWPLTLKIDRATWPFLKLDMWHWVYWYATWLSKRWLHETGLFLIYLHSTCDMDMNRRQRHATCLKTDRRHGDPPSRAPVLAE